MTRGKGSALFGAVAAICAAASGPAAAQCGIASWYGGSGGKTTSGEKHSAKSYTAAHRTLPMGSMVRVRHQRTGREVLVRINDRGPFIHKRIIDLSRAASKALGMGGLAPVCLSVLSKDEAKAATAGWAAQTETQPQAKTHEAQAAESCGAADGVATACR